MLSASQFDFHTLYMCVQRSHQYLRWYTWEPQTGLSDLGRSPQTACPTTRGPVVLQLVEHSSKWGDPCLNLPLSRRCVQTVWAGEMVNPAPFSSLDCQSKVCFPPNHSRASPKISQKCVPTAATSQTFSWLSFMSCLEYKLSLSAFLCSQCMGRHQSI